MIFKVILLLSFLVARISVVKAQYACAAALCAQGHYCREVPTRCYRPPCPTQAVCVPITPTPQRPPANKPGTCPGYGTGIQARHFPSCPARCSSDSSCPGSQKCCFYGCGMRCVTVQTTPVKSQARALATKHAISRHAPHNAPLTIPVQEVRNVAFLAVACVEKRCDLVSEVTCIWGKYPYPYIHKCGTGCEGRRLCYEAQPTKPGSCPRAPYGVVTPCVVGCTSDQSCSGSLKCCSWGCSRRCMSPSSTTTSKPGYCPREYITYLCVRSFDSCQSDYHCTGSMKCCSRPCGKRCLIPTRYPAIG